MSCTYIQLLAPTIIFRELPTRMVYLNYIPCLRYTILAGNPWFTVSTTTHSLRTIYFERYKRGAGIAQLVVLGLAVHSVAGSILLWGHFPVEGIFPLELTWVQTPFPKNSFGWEYKPRSSLCNHAFHRTGSKDPDVHVLDGWMPATKTHPARTIHEDGMWLP